MNLDNLNILGIDIGSISISIAELNHEKRILNNAYTFHRGEIRKNLIKLLTNFNLQRIGYVATTSSSPAIFKQAMQYDSKVSLISAAKKLHQKVGSIIAVGGEKFGLISFDESGDYLSYKSNTSCAAGTGGFLDQQANRLNL